MKNNKLNNKKELFRVKILRNKNDKELDRNIEKYISKNKIKDILDIKFSNYVCENSSQEEYYSAMIFFNKNI
jgi:hypothetical protein